jgi:excisionase family DNA binding protein
MQTTSNSYDPIRSPKELAARWGVSIDTVRRVVAAGELKVVRLSPRRIGIRASEEERYLREREGHRA